MISLASWLDSWLVGGLGLESILTFSAKLIFSETIPSIYQNTYLHRPFVDKDVFYFSISIPSGIVSEHQPDANLAALFLKRLAHLLRYG